MATVDSLDIQISAQVNKANASLTTLINRLDRVSTSLSGVNTRGLATMGAGINKLANAMSNFSANTKTADFSRISRNLASISKIDTSNFSDISSKMSQLSTAFNSFGAVPDSAQQIGEFSRNISKLGNKGITNAITNIPQLATAMKDLMQTLSTAPAVSQNVIQMTNALANLASQGGKVGTASRTMVSGLINTSAAMNRARNSSLSLAVALGKLYIVLRGMRKLWKSIESSFDYLEVLNYFDAAFGQVAQNADLSAFEQMGYDSAEAYYQSFAKRAEELTAKMSGFTVGKNGVLQATGGASLGLDPSQLMNYQAMFGQMASSMGITSETALKLSQALTEIGADLASVKNLDFEEVWTDMASGLAGMSRTLDKYGVNIRNVNLQQKLTELGIEANISALNQNDKALLRTIILLDSTKYAWGDLADTISQPANQLRLIQANFQNLSRTIGNLFLPLVQKVLPYINALVIATQRLFTWLGNLIGIDLSGISTKIGSADIGGLLDQTDELAGNLGDVKKAADKLNKSLRQFDELKVISTKGDEDAGTGAIGGISGGLLDAVFEDAFSEYQKVWDEAFANLENKAQKIADKIEKAFEPVKKFFKNIFKNIDFESFSETIGDLVKKLKNIPSAIGIGLITFVKGLTNIGAVAITAINIALEGLSIVLEMFGLDYKKIAVGLGALFTSIVAFKAIMGLQTLIQGLATGFGVLLSTIAAHPIAAIAAALIGIATAVSGFFALSDTAKEDSLIVSEAVESLINSVNDSINSMGKQYQDLTAQYGATRAIADEYFKLAENFENLTDEEMELLKTYAQILVDDCPELANSIDVVTGAFIGQKAEVYKTIDSLEQYAKKLAMQEILKDLYKDQINLEIAIKNNSKAYEEARKTITKYLEEATRKTGSLTEEELQQYLATSSLNELYKVYSDSIERNGGAIEYTQEEIDALIGDQKALQKSMEESERAIDVATETIKQSAKESATAFEKSSNNINVSIEKTEERMRRWANNSKVTGLNAGEGAASAFINRFSTINKSAEPVISSLKNNLLTEGLNIGQGTGENIAASMIDSIERKSAELRNKLSSIFSGMTAVVNLTGNQIRVSAPAYAMGGFPEDGWFRASKGEYFGQFDDGTSYIANNNQIEMGIAAGVEQAAYQGMVRAMKEMGGFGTNVKVTLDPKSESMFKIVKSESDSYINRTRRNPWTGERL